MKHIQAYLTFVSLYDNHVRLTVFGMDGNTYCNDMYSCDKILLLFEKMQDYKQNRDFAVFEKTKDYICRILIKHNNDILTERRQLNKKRIIKLLTMLR